MAASADRLRGYLRLAPDDPADLDLFIAAAKSKARAAGVPDYAHNAQYDIFILALAAMYYDNRGMSFPGTYQQAAEENARRMINAFVLELRYAEEDGPP
jgi:hypothetical protein